MALTKSRARSARARIGRPRTVQLKTKVWSTNSAAGRSFALIMSCDGSIRASTGAWTRAYVAEPSHPPTPAKINAAATANGQILRIRVSPVPLAQARRTALPRPPNALHAVAFDQFSFKDDPYRTDVAAAGKVYRQYRRGSVAVSDLPSRDTNDTNAAGRRYMADTGSR